MPVTRGRPNCAGYCAGSHSAVRPRTLCTPRESFKLRSRCDYRSKKAWLA